MSNIDLDWVDESSHIYCLLVVDVKGSNPNGDPDRGGDPRQLADDRGLITKYSIRRKIRDMIEQKDSKIWQEVAKELSLDPSYYYISESRNAERKLMLEEIDNGTFASKYVDVRLFGSTFLEGKSEKNTKDGGEDDGGEDNDANGRKKRGGKKKRGRGREFVKTGIVSMGNALSLLPVTLDISTITSKSGKEEGKDQGMAPGGCKMVVHGIYTEEININITEMKRFGCSYNDIKLFLRLLPMTYALSSSARAGTNVHSLWMVGFNTPFPRGIGNGSLYNLLCPIPKNGLPDHIDAQHYNFVSEVPDEIKNESEIIFCGNSERLIGEDFVFFKR